MSHYLLKKSFEESNQFDKGIFKFKCRLFHAREESDVGNTIIDIEEIKDGGEVEEIG